MVGETDASISRTRKNSGKNENEGQKGTYSRRKEKKRAKFNNDSDKDSLKSNDTYEHNHLVDQFVQDVITKAKDEYLSQCTNHHGDDDVNSNEALLINRQKENESEHDRLVEDKSSEKQTSSNDKQKRRHHYKYSDPVDAKEISEYEPQEGSLLKSSRNANSAEPDTEHHGFYQRSLASCRRLLGCCFGKT